MKNAEDARFCQNCGAAMHPPVAPVPPIPVPPSAKTVEYAGFWRRFLAILIDNIILSIPSWLISMIFGLSSFSVLNSLDDIEDAGAMIASLVAALFWVWLINIVMDWLYHAIFESSTLQATPGKMALGIVVTDADGEQISFARATGRHFGKIVSGMILLIGYMMAGWTRKKQALHDIMANCLVVLK